MNVTARQIMTLAAAGSLALLVGAYVFQALGYAPCKLCLWQRWPHGAAVVLVGEPGGLYGGRYPKEYERLAKTYRTFYVENILSGLIGRDEYMADTIHPNDAGYRMAAGRILPMVEAALGGRP